MFGKVLVKFGDDWLSSASSSSSSPSSILCSIECTFIFFYSRAKKFLIAILEKMNSCATGVVIKNTVTNKPYKYIEGEERKIEGNTKGNTLKNKTLRQLASKIAGKNRS